MKLTVATNNRGKLYEIKQMMAGDDVELLTLSDRGIKIDVEENGTTFEENALIKARAVYELIHEPVMADDSGICVDALGGAPGIYTARYSGEGATNDKNIDKLLSEMKDVPDGERSCRFVCAIAYIDENGNESVFRGECEGIVTRERRGTDGMGYDPIFYYPPYKKTFAECSDEDKNKASHRNAAIVKMRDAVIK